MKPALWLGIAFCFVGAGILVWQGITWTSHETLLDVGPIHATTEKKQTLPLPPILGVIAIVAGGALLVVGTRK